MNLRAIIGGGLIALGAMALPATSWSQERYALLIGISDYGVAGSGSGESVPPLQFPDDDVISLQKALEDQDWKVTPLLNEKAKRSDILWQLADYNRRLTDKDTILIYFAGHGLRNKRGRTYWVAYDTGPAMLDFQGIRLSHILDIIADLPPATKIVLLDHCFAGNLEVDRAQPAAAESRGPADRTAPGFHISVAQDPKIASEQAREIMSADVQRASVASDHMVVIGAARGSAFEPSDLQHGLFTNYLLEALSTSFADTSNDAQLSVFELVTYLKTKMNEYANRKGFVQSPLVAPADGDFTEFANLTLFSLKRTPGSLLITKQRYLKKLAVWAAPSKKWISEDTMNQMAERLNRWYEAQTSTQPNRPLLTPEESDLVEALGRAVDSNSPPGEHDRADLFEARAAAERTR